MSAPESRDNLKGAAWLLADMSLNIWALSIVKWLGAGYPAAQVVFIRAGVGFIVIAPLIWRGRSAFLGLANPVLHFVRVLLAVTALSASFFALPRVPLATFTAIGFIRPLVTMMMAAVILRETIGLRLWVAGAVAFGGILIAVNPRDVPWNSGVAAMGVMVLAASATVIATRRLREAPVIVMMTFYTAGLAFCTSPFALTGWHPVQQGHGIPLIAIGCFAQVAQMCFLRAHYFGSAGVLSVLSYTSLIFSVGVGYFVFAERPGPAFAAGAALVISAALWATADPRALRQKS